MTKIDPEICLVETASLHERLNELLEVLTRILEFIDPERPLDGLCVTVH
jgi:hypothetical protein